MGNTSSSTDAEKDARWRAMYSGCVSYFPAVRGASVAELLALQRAARDEGGPRVVLVDCRSASEQRVSVIPGAITQGALQASMAAAMPSGAAGGGEQPLVVVCYCTIGFRSGLHAKALQQEHGGDDALDVRNLEGSLLAWAHAQQDLEDADGQPTRKLHVYGKRWDLAPQSYDTTWHGLLGSWTNIF